MFDCNASTSRFISTDLQQHMDTAAQKVQDTEMLNQKVREYEDILKNGGDPWSAPVPERTIPPHGGCGGDTLWTCEGSRFRGGAALRKF